MKKILPAILICFVMLLNACTKSGSETITGKWSVVSDSMITRGASVSYNVYRGIRGDYFNFESNGLLCTKESSTYDTISYKLTIANTMSLVKSGVSINTIPEIGTYIITDNKVRIVVTPTLTNPGSSYQRTINLRR